MTMLENESSVAVGDLLTTARQLREQKARLATATAIDEIDHFDVLYHFVIGGQMKHIRVSICLEEPVPSLSGIYPGAFYVENEIQDLFGIKFENLSIDYQGRLYMTEGMVHPMRKPREQPAEHNSNGKSTTGDTTRTAGQGTA